MEGITMNEKWQNWEGRLAELSLDEKQDLMRYLTKVMVAEEKEILAKLYPKKPFLYALVSEMAYQKRASLAEVAKEVGISPQHLNNVMKTSKMGLNTLRRLHSRLGIGLFLLEE